MAAILFSMGSMPAAEMMCPRNSQRRNPKWHFSGLTCRFHLARRSMTMDSDAMWSASVPAVVTRT
eukprot:scaffold318075_cov13-Prasinocladus_malaysianus.AAC.1